jgi:hypothetical protein
MKNLQRGFVLPAILAIIALLVAGGGVYVYKNKKIEVSTGGNIKIYEHLSGLYSLSHPVDWIASEVMGGIVFSDLGKKERIGETQNYTNFDHEFGIYIVEKDPKIEAKAMAEYLGKTYVEEDVRISDIDSKRIIYRESKAKNDSYVIPLNNNKFVVISASARDGSDEWLSESYEVTQTMVINVGDDNISNAEIQDNRIKMAEDKKEGDRIDLIIKKFLTDMRASAEIYRDTHSNYAGLCDTKEKPAYITLRNIKDTLYDRLFYCSAEDSYVISVKLYSGEYYCVDSTNFSGVIPSLHPSNSCR